MQLQVFYHKDGTGCTKGPPAENDRRLERGSKDPKAPRSRPRRRSPPTAPALPGESRQGTVGSTADG